MFNYNISRILNLNYLLFILYKIKYNYLTKLVKVNCRNY